MVKSISIFDYKKYKLNGQLLDIRSVQNFNNNHIPNSKHIEWKKLIKEPNKYLNKYNVYYIYCQNGVRSKMVCEHLTKQGYNLINLIGGYESWILES